MKYAPGASDIRHYQRDYLRPDVIAGITVWAYLVPQVMAYARIAGLPIVVGLWASVPALVVYGLLSRSKYLSVGPETSMSIMTASAIAVVATTDHGPTAIAAALSIAVGIVCLVAYFARLSFVANLLSTPVLAGYMAGLAGVMIISQLGKVTGVAVSSRNPFEQIRQVVSQYPSWNMTTVTVSVVGIGALLFLHRMRPKWPGPLLVLVAISMVVLVASLDTPTVGSVPMGLPPLVIPMLSWDAWLELFPYAAGIAVLGFSDSVLTARQLAAEHDEPTDDAQELLALGAANVAAGVFGGLPVANSVSRAALNESLGAKSQMSSMLTAGCVALTLLFLAPVVQRVPDAALGAIVIYAAFRMVNLDSWKRIFRFRKSELVIASATAISVLVLGVLAGIGLAVVLSLLDVIRRLSRPSGGVCGFVPGLAGMHSVSDYPEATQIEGLIVYRYDSPMFFANAEDFLGRATQAAAKDTRWFVLNAEAISEIDLTSVETLKQLRSYLKSRGCVFVLARLKQDLREQLVAAGFFDDGFTQTYPTLPTSVSGYCRWFEKAEGRQPEGVPY